MTETLAHGYLSVLRESFPMNANMSRFRWFTKLFRFLCHGEKLPKVALILKGLMDNEIKGNNICLWVEIQ